MTRNTAVQFQASRANGPGSLMYGQSKSRMGGIRPQSPSLYIFSQRVLLVEMKLPEIDRSPDSLGLKKRRTGEWDVIRKLSFLFGNLTGDPRVGRVSESLRCWAPGEIRLLAGSRILSLSFCVDRFCLLFG